MVVSSALYKLSKNHEQGTRMHIRSLSPTKLDMLLLDLSFEGACSDHPFEYPFVHKRSPSNSITVGRTLQGARSEEQVLLTSSKLDNLTPVSLTSIESPQNYFIYRLTDTKDTRMQSYLLFNYEASFYHLPSRIRFWAFLFIHLQFTWSWNQKGSWNFINGMQTRGRWCSVPC